MKRVATLLALSSWALSAWGAPLTLKDVQNKLGRAKAGWVAGENWVTRLSPSERKLMLGANLPTDFGTYFINRDTKVNRSLPPSFTWGNVNGTNFLSPILNQGRCGSCVAFAAIATLETQTNITRNTPDSPWAFSPQYLFTCGGGGCETGWQPSSAADFLETTGVPDEACFPYTEGAIGTDASCSAACSNAASRSLKITGSSMPTFFMQDINAIKTALQSGPLITTLTVYNDFFFYKTGVYKHTTGDVAGGHAVSIVGYSDADQAWIVRNSWGPDWGDNGFIKVAWSDDSGVGLQTWKLEVPAANGYVTLGSLRDHTVLKGVVNLDINSTFSGTDSTEWTLTNGGRFLAWGTRGNTLQTTQYADGIYTLTAVAHHAGQTDLSQPRVVYLLNGTLTGSVAFTNLTAGQSIAAKTFVMEMSTQSAPIPFARVTFHAKNVASGHEFQKYTWNVAGRMAMSWRQDVAAGEYDVWLEGSAGDQKVASAPLRITVTD